MYAAVNAGPGTASRREGGIIGHWRTGPSDRTMRTSTEAAGISLMTDRSRYKAPVRAGRRLLRPLGALLTPALLAGCVNMGSMAESLGDSMASQPDPDVVRSGGPAWLILADALAEERPDDADVRFAAGRMYAAYGGSLVDDPARRRLLTDQGRAHARAGLCASLDDVCAAPQGDFAAFRGAVAAVDDEHIDALYDYAVVEATWIQAHSDSQAALARLPWVETAFERVLAVEPTIDRGNAHLYMGVLLAQRPASLGGRPEQARAHFERAIEISDGRNLMAKTLYAEHYARLVFDRELHDRLLEEVLAADVRAGTLTLANTLAQRRARALLDESDDFF